MVYFKYVKPLQCFYTPEGVLYTKTEDGKAKRATIVDVHNHEEYEGSTLQLHPDQLVNPIALTGFVKEALQLINGKAVVTLL